MKLIVAGVGCVSAKYLPDAMRGAGHEPVLIADPARYSGAARDAVRDCAWLAADITDPGDIVRALTARPDVLAGATAITSPFDEVFPVTARVAEKLGLAHPPPAFAELADKARVAALVPEHSPWTRTVDPRAIPDDLVAGASVPVLLKPSLCTGALGVRVLSTPAELTPASILETMRGAGVPDALEQPWLLQQVVSGDLISLEGYLRAGRLTVLGFSRRTRIGATEVSNLFPADETLSGAVRDQCVEAVTALAERGGLRTGYVHCEFLVTAERAHLIDANLGRVGGAAIVEQIALAHRVDPGEVVRHALLLPFDPDAPTPAYRPEEQRRRTTSFWYGLRDGGTVRSISGAAGGPCLHTQFAVAGQRVPAVGVSDYAWVGMFTGLSADAERDIDRVVIHADEGDLPAYCRP